jgi:bis(5'-nucleosidyl)-tetraphosphatase
MFMQPVQMMVRNHPHAFAIPHSPPQDPIRLKRCGIICVKTIFNIPHVLLVRGKRSKIWSLPKGCIDDEETEVECAQREMLEETGVNVSIDTSIHPRVMINHNVYFLVHIQHNPKLKIRDRGEIDKVNWITLSELRSMNSNKDLRSILQYPCRKFGFHTILLDALKLNENENENVISYERPPGL